MTDKTDLAAAAALAAAQADAADAAPRVSLWALAVTVPSIKALVPVTLDLSSDNYSPWRGLFEVVLQKYTLDDHIRAPSTSDLGAQWLRLDALVRSWLYGAISSELLAMVMDPSASAYILWTHIEGLYRDNAETHAIYLEQEFHRLMQGATSVAEY